MGILDTLFGTSYQTPGINPDASIPNQTPLGENGLPNVFMTPNLAEAGLLGGNPQEALALQNALQSQATKAGLLSAGVSFLTQPRNLRAGSALPYLGRAYQQGMASAGDIYGTGLRQLATQQAFGQKKQYQTIDLGDKVILANPATGETIREVPKGVAPGKGEATKTTIVQQLEALKDINSQLEQKPDDEYLNQAKQALLVELQLKPKAEQPLTKAEEFQETLTETDVTRDKELIKELKSFETNEFSGITKNIGQIDSAINSLKTAEEGQLTGKGVGLAYDTGTLDYLNPEAKSTLEAVQEVVQQNLRLVLGAQFTEREGSRLIERAYNPRLSQKENIVRLERLKKQILDSYNQKKNMLDYFNEKGTFKGYEGKAIEDVLPKQAPKQSTQQPKTMTAPQSGTVMNGWRFKGGDPSNKNNWEKI